MSNTISKTWSELKVIQATKQLPWQYEETSDVYRVFLVDGVIRYETVLWKTAGSLVGGMPAGMDTDRADFETNVIPKCNLIPTTGPRAGGRSQISTFPTEGSSVNIFSHDWCNPTTWYTQAVRVVDEVATDSGDQITWNLSRQNIIDTYHGKITGEDFLSDSGGNSYRVSVTVDGVAKAEVDPHTGVGDFTVDYANGKIVFGSALNVGAVVKATYHYENGSLFIVAPDSGKRLLLKRVEVQFTDNINITDTIKFIPYGLVDVFAPSLVNNPYPSGTKIPINDGTVYKTMQDYINESNGAQPKIIDLGGSSSNWRASQNKTVILVWDYMTVDYISSAAGVELHTYLDHDTPFSSINTTPASAIATFYCLSEDEV